MSYRKFVVDNVLCSRRFHLSYDTEDATIPKVEVRCKHCGIVVFAAADHPPVLLARDENLTQSTSLSDHLLKTCEFKDTFSPASRT